MSKSIVAIIPVRGGSKGIPRKNARLLHGKPLLAYSIETALKVPRINAVYVSTDDPELEMIGRKFGAQILERPARLAEDQITLDEVILDAVTQLESKGQRIDYIITIQATSPLISWQSIDAAISKCIDNGRDTVVSVIDDRHLRWGEANKGELVRLYKERVNRQKLPKEYRETGGVVVCSRSTLKKGSRFGNKVGLIELSKTEAIDIDDRFDWWVAEKSLARRKICFHVTGNRENGTGHVHRALTIADRMIDHEIWFLVNEKANIAADMIKQRYYPLKVVPVGQEANAILKEKANLVINDVLDTSKVFLKKLKNNGIFTINFEDMGHGSKMADYVINEMYDNHPDRGDKRTLSGERYACLRDEFYLAKPIKIKKRVENILLMFGGTDPNNLTMRTLQWLDGLSGDWKVTVLLGIGYTNVKQVLNFARQSEHKIEIIRNTPIVSQHMANSDIAITSAGRTVFELASIGIPMVVICQNRREKLHTFANESLGVVALGLQSKLKREIFLDSMVKVIGSPLLREKMHQTLLKADIKKGVDRVLEVIEDMLKEANGGSNR